MGATLAAASADWWNRPLNADVPTAGALVLFVAVTVFALWWWRQPERASIVFVWPAVFACVCVWPFLLLEENRGAVAVTAGLSATIALALTAGTLAHARWRTYELPDLLGLHVGGVGFEENGVQFAVLKPHDTPAGGVCYVDVCLQNAFESRRGVRAKLFTPIDEKSARDVALPVLGACTLEPLQFGVLRIPIKTGVNAEGLVIFRLKVSVSGPARGRRRKRIAPAYAPREELDLTFTLNVLPIDRGAPPADLEPARFIPLWERGDEPTKLRVPEDDVTPAEGRSLRTRPL